MSRDKHQPDWIDLIKTIVAGTVKLEDAACAGLHDVMDDVDDPAAGLSVCASCPTATRARCSDWAAGLTDRDISGVVAGEVREWVQHPKPTTTETSSMTVIDVVCRKFAGCFAYLNRLVRQYQPLSMLGPAQTPRTLEPTTDARTKTLLSCGNGRGGSKVIPPRTAPRHGPDFFTRQIFVQRCNFLQPPQQSSAKLLTSQFGPDPGKSNPSEKLTIRS
jgi:hypothetical protein